MLALDIDGTLLDSQHKESPLLTSGLRALAARGTVVVLVSSRPPFAISPLVHWGESEPVPFIAFQGAMTLQLEAGHTSVLSERQIPLETAREIVGLSRNLGAVSNWYSGRRWLVAQEHTLISAEAKIVGLQPELFDLANVEEAPHKLLILTSGADADAILRSRMANIPVSVETSKPGYIEITARSTSKGQALGQLMGNLGIVATDSVAIGDGLNDLSMFKQVGISIAMANAPAEVREKARRITTSNDEEGVLLAIRDLVPDL